MSSVCVFPEWKTVESGVITVLPSLLCTQVQPMLSWESEWRSQVLASPQGIHMPSRKRKQRPGMGRTGFGPTESSEGLEERRPSPGDLGGALYNETIHTHTHP